MSKSFERLLRAAKEMRGAVAADANGWLAIETAPKDGAEVILSDGVDVGSGFYSEAIGSRRAKAGWFLEMDRGDMLIARNFPATHWQPLPKAPATEGAAS